MKKAISNRDLMSNGWMHAGASGERKWRVHKFGGTSVGSSEAMLSVKSIIEDMLRDDTPLAIVVWVLAALLALFDCFITAELSTLLPHAGGPYEWIRRAWGESASFVFVFTKIPVHVYFEFAVSTFLLDDDAGVTDSFRVAEDCENYPQTSDFPNSHNSPNLPTP